MGRDLYEHLPAFREAVDRCCELLEPLLGLDLRTCLYGDAGERLRETELAQPALFVTSYALAATLMGWGVRPQAMVGHSLGEYVAACVAGVFSLQDALRVVVARGRLMQAAPEGTMLSVRLGADGLLPLLPPDVSLAAVNGPAQCAVSGPVTAIEAFEAELAARGTPCRRLHVTRAMHSALLDPVVSPLVEAVAAVPRHAPEIPFATNVGGTWASAADVTDPAYWGRQLRRPVEFARGLATVLEGADGVLLEVGPGTALSSLARPQAGGWPVVASMRHPEDPTPDRTVLLGALGQLWLAGVPVDWLAFAKPERRLRVPLPLYPFERQSYWIGAELAAPAVELEAAARAHVAPRTSFERHVATIWQDLIGIDRVGAGDNFFDLGGDSLLATMLLARLVEVFGVDVPLRLVFECPTLADLASQIEDLMLKKLDAL
jgi:acyl transferase domain-containing protein